LEQKQTAATREAAKPNLCGSLPLVGTEQSSQLDPGSLFVQRLHGTIGNRHAGRWLQTKLKIGSPNDEYEQEADRVADQVMRMPAPAFKGNAAPPAIQRKCAKCEEEEHSTEPAIQRKCEECGHEAPIRQVQSKSSGPAGPQVNANLQSRIEQLRGGGEPLSAELRSYFEPRMGNDFSGVRVHTNPEAAGTASALNALAFTSGRNIFFGAGNYAPGSAEGKRLLAHELVHVVQQRDSHAVVMRSTGSASSGSGAPAGPPATGTSSATAPARINADVLSAANPEDFLVRAAAEALGTDIRVRSMVDMVDQLEHLTAGNTCLARLSIYNHGNPDWQLASGGSHSTKAQPATVSGVHDEGFSLNWLTNSGNQGTLNRMRHAFCCSPTVNWYGCSTAGVWAEGGERTADEVRQSSERYTGVLGNFYHDVAEAAAHGATSFRAIGPVNVQSWSNALCSTVNAATDFNNWQTTGSGVVRTVIHGGQMVAYSPERSIGCACDATSGRLTGSAPTAAELGQHATELREQALHPLYEQTRSVLGTHVTPPTETADQRTEREHFEQEQASFFTEVGRNIRTAVLEHAGFAQGTQPTTADEALRVTSMWGLDINHIVTNLGRLSASLSGRTTTATAAGLDQQQRSLEAALTPRGREIFMDALRMVRQEHFWNQHLQNHMIYIFPDLTGANRYRGYTQHSSQTNSSGQTEEVWVIHISKDLLETVPAAGEEPPTRLVATSMVHELSHTLGTNVLERSMQPFERELVDLLVDHPQIAALRTGATDPAAARQEHIQMLRQMIHDATTYAEGEIFVHLQQLSHQPDMMVSGTGVRGSDFILDQVSSWIHRLACIGLQPHFLAGLLASIRRRVMRTYDDRIAAAPAGSRERRLLELDKQLADAIWAPALTQAQGMRCQP